MQISLPSAISDPMDANRQRKGFQFSHSLISLCPEIRAPAVPSNRGLPLSFSTQPTVVAITYNVYVASENSLANNSVER